MLLGNRRPAGQRLAAASPVRMKCMNVVPQCYKPGVAATSNWAKMMTDWNWVGWVKPQIDLAKANGANAIKLTVSGGGISEVAGSSGSAAAGGAGGDPWPSVETLYNQLTGLFAYCKQQNLGVYMQLAPGGSQIWGQPDTGARVAAAVQVAQCCEGPGSPVWLIDMCNEVQFGPPASWGTTSSLNLTQMVSDLRAFRTALRTATSLPLTASVYLDSPASWTGPIVEALADVVDLHDGHPYYGSDGPVVPYIPGLSDVQSLVAQSWFKGRFLLGEAGVAQSATQATQVAYLNGVGALASHPSCAGAVAFSVADYAYATPGDRIGFSDQNVQNPRSWMFGSFQTWPKAN